MLMAAHRILPLKFSQHQVVMLIVQLTGQQPYAPVQLKHLLIMALRTLKISPLPGVYLTIRVQLLAVQVKPVYLLKLLQIIYAPEIIPFIS